MKLTHIANALTIALLLVTAWLAWEASKEAKIAADKVDRLTAHQRQMESMQPQVIHATSAPPAADGTAAIHPPMIPVQPSPQPPSNPVPANTPAGTAAQAPTPEPTAAALAATGNPAIIAPAVANTAPSPAPLPPGTLTPLQRRVRDAPALGKIKDFVAEHGFVTFEAPADFGLKPGMKFDLRRDSSVVGRITIAAIEPEAVVADLDPKSVPEGVEVKAGDDIISVMAPMPK
ncbi:MAG: hypothetical protein JNJ83_07140 [Verrucomicrobiaceae bacterium]|nr:hypothetical protein [Verrucomicrobiaceae bacterium]